MTFRRGQDDHLDGIQRRVRDLEGQDGGPLLVEDVPGVHVAILPEHQDELEELILRHCLVTKKTEGLLGLQHPSVSLSV